MGLSGPIKNGVGTPRLQPSSLRGNSMGSEHRAPLVCGQLEAMGHVLSEKVVEHMLTCFP
jgi:hypothetical protein